jgi:hypothetical protein
VRTLPAIVSALRARACWCSTKPSIIFSNTASAGRSIVTPGTTYSVATPGTCGWG